jgi:hypothetical protein
MPVSTMQRRTRTNGRGRALVLLGGALALLCTHVFCTSASARPLPDKAHKPTQRPAKPLKAIYGPLRMPDGSSAFPVYHRLGVRVLETHLSWDKVAPTRPGDPANPADPAYRWPAELDNAIRQAARYHIAIALLVEDFPAWSNGGRDATWAPDDPSDYARFVAATSRRYPSIHLWMILNEVNSSMNFMPVSPGSPVGPERYAQLLDLAYGALKAVSRLNTVIGGMTYSTGTIGTFQFIRSMRLPDGRPPRMDYYGHNPYSIRYPDLAKKPISAMVCDIDDIDTLEQRLAAIYHGHAPRLWLSEFGISDAPNSSFDYYVSRPVQARWVTAAYRLVNSVSYVAAMGWYELLDEPATSRGHLSEGLMTATGAPKPAFYAYASVP